MKVELKKGNLVDKFSVKGELSEVIKKLKGGIKYESTINKR